MNTTDLIQALGLPDTTLLNQRIPKKMLAEQAAATPADRRQIQDGVDDITWVAALKPHLIGVPAYEDAQRTYLELAIVALKLKAGHKPGRMVELLHRAIPYPLLLLTSSDQGLALSLSHLRHSQMEADKTVLDGELLSVNVSDTEPSAPVINAFTAALALSRQPQASLHALYQGWFDTVDALAIAQHTGCFQPSLTRELAAQRHAALQQCRELEAQLQRLRVQAQKERQLARQVALNQELRAGQAQLQALKQQLQG